EDPLLVSVRSGAKFSIPGMMDTILNLRLNDRTEEELAKLTEDLRFSYDSYRRFIQMFGNVVLGIAKEKFEQQLTKIKADRRYKVDTEMKAEDWKALIAEYKKIVEKETGNPFPQDPHQQLTMA